MKLKVLESMLRNPELEKLKPELKIAAQKVYDEWEEEDIDTYGGGGICHLISDAFCEIFDNHGYECTSICAAVGENHTFAVVKTDDGIYTVDISPYVYERGGGYTWEKIPHVEITENDIMIELISRDTEDFEKHYVDY